MPEVIMSYELYEGDMIALKRREPLIRCRDCKYYLAESKYCSVWNNTIGFPLVNEDMYCSMAKHKKV